MRPRYGPKSSRLTQPPRTAKADGHPRTTCPPFAAGSGRALANPAEARHEMKPGEGGSPSAAPHGSDRRRHRGGGSSSEIGRRAGKAWKHKQVKFIFTPSGITRRRSSGRRGAWDKRPPMGLPCGPGARRESPCPPAFATADRRERARLPGRALAKPAEAQHATGTGRRRGREGACEARRSPARDKTWRRRVLKRRAARIRPPPSSRPPPVPGPRFVV